MKTLLKAVALVAVVALAGSALFIYSGIFEPAADVPHWPVVHKALETLRERSIAARAKGITVPPLDDAKMISEGAEHYAAMCTGCHLAPGMADSEIRPGLYPQPPNLSEHAHASPAEMFWTIKHGVKMSAMPAWGNSHDDAAIWGMVAFLQKLPHMTPEQYKQLTSAGEAHEEGHHHHHDGEASEVANTESEAHGHEHAHGADESEHERTRGTGESNAPSTPATDAAKAETISLEGLKPKAAPPAEAVADAFHVAMKKGDRAAVMALLAPEATLREGGHSQTRDEYAAGHLAEDIAFLKDATLTPVSLGSMPMGDSAMVGSETTIATTEKGKPVTLRSREMLTIKKIDGRWLIVSVLWQSEPRP